MGRIHVVPDDATAIDDWENIHGEHDGTPRPFRYFTGSSWRIPVTKTWVSYSQDIIVEIRGRQFADGRVERWVHTDVPRMDSVSEFALPPQSAQLLAQAYADAAAEIERLADPAVSNRCDHRWAICEGVSHCCALSAGHSSDTHVCLCHAEMNDDGAVR